MIDGAQAPAGGAGAETTLPAALTAADVIQELLRQRAQAKAHGEVATAAVLQRAIGTIRRRFAQPKVELESGAP